MEQRNQFQAFPFHLVDQSPWPILISFSTLIMAIAGVMSFHGFANGGKLLLLGFILTVTVMLLWFKDVITEGTIKVNFLVFRGFKSWWCIRPENTLFLLASIILYNFSSTSASRHTEDLSTSAIKGVRTIPKEIVLEQVDTTNYIFKLSTEDLGYYLAGLLEGDGSINLPSIGKTSLKRILNPRIIFTSHINNLKLYANIQHNLGGTGRFQFQSPNTIRYIIGDITSIKSFIDLVHGKLRTPKNTRFNQLIAFMNEKYTLNLLESMLDNSMLNNNYWFAGFTEADGHFGVRCTEFKPKTAFKRSVSSSARILFRLDQRAIDHSTLLSLSPVMKEIASFLNCNLSTYLMRTNTKCEEKVEILSVSITSVEKVKTLVTYFNKYPLLGVKGKDYKDWEVVYNMIIRKEHLTDKGRFKIKQILSNMNSKRKLPILSLPE
jgi:hypothetical protein